jgi:hypothetical protein
LAHKKEQPNIFPQEIACQPGIQTTECSNLWKNGGKSIFERCFSQQLHDPEWFRLGRIMNPEPIHLLSRNSMLTPPSSLSSDFSIMSL